MNEVLSKVFHLFKSQSSESNYFENLLCKIQSILLKKQSFNLWINKSEGGLGKIVRFT